LISQVTIYLINERGGDGSMGLFLWLFMRFCV
jgi:hypothetical protein